MTADLGHKEQKLRRAGEVGGAAAFSEVLLECHRGIRHCRSPWVNRSLPPAPPDKPLPSHDTGLSGTMMLALLPLLCFDY